MVSLVPYHGLMVLSSPPPPIPGDAGKALQDDLKFLVDWNPKSSWANSVDPAVGDDEADDYYPGSMWLRTDTTPPRLFICKTSATGAAVWIQLQTQLGFNVVTKTAAYTLTTVDDIVLGNATGGAFSVTLPTAVGISGREYVVKRINSGANSVTVGTTGGQTIDGAATKVLNAQYLSARMVSDGTNWLLV